MDDRRRLSFGGVAELYDRSRPSYPEALVDGVLEFAGVGTGAGAGAGTRAGAGAGTRAGAGAGTRAGAGERDRAVEVGAGTGKATALFAGRGLSIVAIEPSADMAHVARRHFAGFENVTIEQVEFERWRAPGHVFRLLFSAQAWHWIAPEVRYVAARAALEDGGTLAAFWNRPDWTACDLCEEFGEAYRRNGRAGDAEDPMNPTAPTEARSADDFWSTEIAGASGFDGAEVRHYPWHQDYTTAEYLALLGTHSACVVLDAPERERLLGDIAAAIDARGGGFRMTYVTVLFLARAS